MYPFLFLSFRHVACWNWHSTKYSLLPRLRWASPSTSLDKKINLILNCEYYFILFLMSCQIFFKNKFVSLWVRENPYRDG